MDKKTFESGLVGVIGMDFSFNLNGLQDKYNLKLGLCPCKSILEEKKWSDLEFKNLTQEEMKDVVNAFYELADWLKEGYTDITGNNFKRRKEKYLCFEVNK